MSDISASLITLDGRLKSNLDWQAAQESAQIAVQEEKKIFWQMDLGLFDDLAFPLTNQAQYLSLGLAIDHFCNTLGKEWVDHSLGLSVYCGSADFSTTFLWDEEHLYNWRLWLRQFFIDEAQAESEIGIQWDSFEHAQITDCCKTLEGKHILRLFCRDVAIEYISLLTNRLPAATDPYVLFNLQGVASDEISTMQLMHPYCFGHLQVGVQGTALPLLYKRWNRHGHDKITLELAPTHVGNIGICLPNPSTAWLSQWHKLKEPIQTLSERSILYRIMTEENLTASWDELDFLLYVPQALSIQGKRKLLGFCAAGGTVVSIDEVTGNFPGEMMWQDFKENL